MRYRDMDFIQNVLNGMASRRPRLDALRDSWYDCDTICRPRNPLLAVLSTDDGAGVTQGALKLQTPASLFLAFASSGAA